MAEVPVAGRKLVEGSGFRRRGTCRCCNRREFVSPLAPTNRLTEKDTIVLADFTNTTGDTVFDGTLRQGLSAQLEQSPFLNLLSDEQIAQTLALMAQPKDARLTTRVGPRGLPAHRRAPPPSKARFPVWAASMSWG